MRLPHGVWHGWQRQFSSATRVFTRAQAFPTDAASFPRKRSAYPVISIGVPTVVDAATLAYDLLGKDADEQAAAALLAGDGKDMFVTLKESDVITKQTARLLGFAINRAFHGDMSVEEMEELLS